MLFQKNKRAPSRRNETFSSLNGTFQVFLTVGGTVGGRVLLVVYTVESKGPSLAALTDNQSPSTCINILAQVYLKGRLIVKFTK